MRIKLKVKSLSHVWLLATPWTAAYQVPPSMGFSRQEYWSGVPLPSPKWVNICESIYYIVKVVLVTQLSLTLWDPMDYIAWQAPLSMEFFRQESWSGLPFPPLGKSSCSRDRSRFFYITGRFFTMWATREAHMLPYLEHAVNAEQKVTLAS